MTGTYGQVLIESAMLADGTTHEDLDATLRALAKGGLAAFRTRRVVELVGMLTVLAGASKQRLGHMEIGGDRWDMGAKERRY